METFCEDSGDVGLPQLGAAQSLKPQRVENGSRGIVAALRCSAAAHSGHPHPKYQNLKVRRATDNKSEYGEYSRKAPSVRVLKTHCRDPQSQMQKAAQINANHGKATRRLTLFCIARQHKHWTFVKLLETTFGLGLQMFLAYIFSHGNDRLIDMVPALQLFSLRDIREHYLRISKPRNSQKTELYIWDYTGRTRTSIFSLTGCVDAMSRIWDVKSNC